MAPSDKALGDDANVELGDGVDAVTFGQILEMDDSDEDREFSKGLVFEFLGQARDTFEKIQKNLDAANPDLKALSDLGHFLKGSSAIIGLVKVKDSCEKIQRYGKKENEDGSPLPDEKECVRRIEDTLKVLVADFEDVEKVLRGFYGDDSDSTKAGA